MAGSLGHNRTITDIIKPLASLEYNDFEVCAKKVKKRKKNKQKGLPREGCHINAISYKTDNDVNWLGDRDAVGLRLGGIEMVGLGVKVRWRSHWRWYDGRS